MKFPFSEIQAATYDFSKENLLGEGGFGHVYKGQLNNGELIAAKLRKEASLEGYAEFVTEVQVLSFARHRNIVGLLGYCCEETYNILVYMQQFPGVALIWCVVQLICIFNTYWEDGADLLVCYCYLVVEQIMISPWAYYSGTRGMQLP